MEKLNINWWKWLTVIFLLYTICLGLLGPVPHLPILNETIRGLYFHVPMWFGMVIIMSISFVYSILYLKNFQLSYDDKACTCVQVGIVMGLLGLISGMLWAKYTWGHYWSNDPKQTNAMIATLMYCSYSVLRNAFSNDLIRPKVASIYNITIYALFIPMLFIIPRLTDSLHPGNGGNPGFNTYDLDWQLRLVFYPAVIGWTLCGIWIAQISWQYKSIKRYYEII